MLAGLQPAHIRPYWRYLKTPDGYVTSFWVSPSDITSETLDELWLTDADVTVMTIRLIADGHEADVSVWVRYHSDKRLHKETFSGLNRLTGRELGAVASSIPAPIRVGRCRCQVAHRRRRGHLGAGGLGRPRDEPAEACDDPAAGLSARCSQRNGRGPAGVRHSVNGLQPSQNPQVALQMFTTATRLDPDMCDAWLARVLAGDQTIEVLTGGWQAVKTFGWELRRLGLSELEFRPEVSDGMFLRLAVTRVESFAAAYAAALTEAKRYAEAAELLDSTEPRHPFDQELLK